MLASSSPCSSSAGTTGGDACLKVANVHSECLKKWWARTSSASFRPRRTSARESSRFIISYYNKNKLIIPHTFPFAHGRILLSSITFCRRITSHGRRGTSNFNSSSPFSPEKLEKGRLEDHGWAHDSQMDVSSLLSLLETSRFGRDAAARLVPGFEKEEMLRRLRTAFVAGDISAFASNSSYCKVGTRCFVIYRLEVCLWGNYHFSWKKLFALLDSLKLLDYLIENEL